MNPNWLRWIIASIKQALSTRLLITIYMADDLRKTRTASQYVEVMPQIVNCKDLGHGEWEILVLVDETLTIETSLAAHQSFSQLLGECVKSLERITLYQYGNESADTQEEFGCLEPEDEILVDDYGFVGKLHQALIRRHFRVRLGETE